MTELRFKELSKKHLPQMLEIERLSFSHPLSEQSYIYELTTNTLAYYYGLLVGDSLLAFGGYWLIIDEGHIANIAVHPDYRHQGIGEALVRRLIAICQASGGKRMTLEVRETNFAAKNLYEKLGFVAHGKRLNYYDDPKEDGIIMWLKLANKE